MNRFLKLSVLSLVVITSFALNANASPGNPNGYFLTILSAASNGGQAVLGNSTNPHLQVLSCEGGFQAEGVFTIICSVGKVPELQNSPLHFFNENILNPSQPGQLTVGGTIINLSCKLRTPGNGFGGAVCR